MIGQHAIDAAIDRILEREGGYVDRPEDRGGPTKFGITLETLVSWRFPNRVTPEDVRELRIEEAREIYRARYITGPKFHELSDVRLFGLLADSGVNHGPQRAVMWLQAAAGAKVDGSMGSQTLAAVSRYDASTLYKRILCARLRFYAHIVAKDRSQAIFIEGWVNRSCEFVDQLELPP